MFLNMKPEDRLGYGLVVLISTLIFFGAASVASAVILTLFGALAFRPLLNAVLVHQGYPPIYLDAVRVIIVVEERHSDYAAAIARAYIDEDDEIPDQTPCSFLIIPASAFEDQELIDELAAFDLGEDEDDA